MMEIEIWSLLVDDPSNTATPIPSLHTTEEDAYQDLADNYAAHRDPDVHPDLTEYVLSQGVTFVVERHVVKDPLILS